MNKYILNFSIDDIKIANKKNNHRFYLLIVFSVKNINMHPVKNHN